MGPKVRRVALAIAALLIVVVIGIAGFAVSVPFWRRHARSRQAATAGEAASQIIAGKGPAFEVLNRVTQEWIRARPWFKSTCRIDRFKFDTNGITVSCAEENLRMHFDKTCSGVVYDVLSLLDAVSCDEVPRLNDISVIMTDKLSIPVVREGLPSHEE